MLRIGGPGKAFDYLERFRRKKLKFRGIQRSRDGQQFTIGRQAGVTPDCNRLCNSGPKREPHELRIPAITIIRIEKPLAARRTYGTNIKRAPRQWSCHGAVEVHPVNANRRSTHRPPRRD